MPGFRKARVTKVSPRKDIRTSPSASPVHEMSVSRSSAFSPPSATRLSTATFSRNMRRLIENPISTANSAELTPFIAAIRDRNEGAVSRAARLGRKVSGFSTILPYRFFADQFGTVTIYSLQARSNWRPTTEVSHCDIKLFKTEIYVNWSPLWIVID